MTTELDRERESMLSKHEDELRQYDIGVILQLDQKVSEQQVVTSGPILIATVQIFIELEHSLVTNGKQITRRLTI